jgi:hypothetical protein
MKSLKLEHGTREEHLGTLRRAFKGLKEDGESYFYVWSGDIRRNPYLAENLDFGANEGIIDLEDVEYSQESGWNVKFLKENF